MATAPTAGYIYLIESDGTDNDDWITDHAGDPDLLDLDVFTEGTEYCKIEMPELFRQDFFTGITVYDVGGGASFDMKYARRFYKVLAMGLPTSRSNGDLVAKFCMLPRHTSGVSATFKRYYLIFYFGVNDHLPFIDAAGATKSYCKGVVTGGSKIWDKSNPLLYTIKLNWRSVW